VLMNVTTLHLLQSQILFMNYLVMVLHKLNQVVHEIIFHIVGSGVQPPVRGGDKWWRRGSSVHQIRATNDTAGTRLLIFGHF
jgi:hypothetical protein